MGGSEMDQNTARVATDKLNAGRPGGRALRRAARVGLVAGMATGIALAGMPAAHAGSAEDWHVVAHRGGVEAAPESTLAAFAHMLDLDADAVEFDIRFTKDNVAVIMHDATVDRTTNCRGAVASITYAALKQCDAGSWFDRTFSDERVPTLAAALRFIDEDASSDFEYLLHLRTITKKQADKIEDIVQEAGVKSQSVPISSSPTTLKYLKDQGLKRQGLVFNTPSGWNTNYKYLIPYNVTSNPSVIKAAHRDNQKVLPVEGHPHSLRTLDGLDVDGVLADDLEAAMDIAGRLLGVDGQDGRDGARARSAATAENDVPAKGPSRTTGPMDF